MRRNVYDLEVKTKFWVPLDAKYETHDDPVTIKSKQLSMLSTSTVITNRYYTFPSQEIDIFHTKTISAK